MTWLPDVFEVKVSRPERRGHLQDVHAWPTPVSSYVRHGQWLPVEGSPMMTTENGCSPVQRMPGFRSAGSYPDSCRRSCRRSGLSSPAILR